jgi:hypothetical protein
MYYTVYTDWRVSMEHLNILKTVYRNSLKFGTLLEVHTYLFKFCRLRFFLTENNCFRGQMLCF